jgi:putative protease
MEEISMVACAAADGHRPEDAIGAVTHYFSHLGVAGVALRDELTIGDRIHVKGHTTDFIQSVDSMEVEHGKVEVAGPDDDVAIKMDDHVRENDLVFREP